jgi:biopolymer transport protein ExbD
MVTTPLIQNGIKVELPKGQVSEIDLAAQPKEWVVSIDAQGTLFLNKQQVTTQDLLQQLRYASENSGVDAVVVRADAGAQFGTIIELVDAIKNIGKIQYVAFATEKIQGGS